jgi:hypothetical protein
MNSYLVIGVSSASLRHLRFNLNQREQAYPSSIQRQEEDDQKLWKQLCSQRTIVLTDKKRTILWTERVEIQANFSAKAACAGMVRARLDFGDTLNARFHAVFDWHSPHTKFWPAANNRWRLSLRL